MPFVQPVAPLPPSVHFWQEPSALQKGAAVVGQTALVAAPLSPLQATQVFDVVLQTGEAPVHAVLFVAEQALHVPATQAGAAVVGQA